MPRLAGCGQGDDALELDDAQRAQLREQALNWLNADLAGWAKVADRPARRAKLSASLRQMQLSADWDGVSGPAIYKLPEAERAGWQKPGPTLTLS